MIPLRKLKMCFTSAIREAKRLEMFDIIKKIVASTFITKDLKILSMHQCDTRNVLFHWK